MPKKTKSKATIKNKNKSKINIKIININSNNKKKVSKSSKQQPQSQPQPNFQNPIIHIQPVAPIQNSSLLDNQFGIGIAKQLNALEGDYVRLKTANEETQHQLNQSRIDNARMADLVQKRVDELKKTSLIRPSDGTLARPNTPIDSQGMSSTTSTTPMKDNDYSKFYTPLETKPLEEIQNEPIKAKKYTRIDATAFNKKLAKRKYDAERYNTDEQIASRAVKDLVAKNNARRVLDAMKEVKAKNETYRANELKRLQENITKEHKEPTQVKRAVGRPKKLQVSPEMKGKIEKYEKK